MQDFFPEGDCFQLCADITVGYFGKESVALLKFELDHETS